MRFAGHFLRAGLLGFSTFLLILIVHHSLPSASFLEPGLAPRTPFSSPDSMVEAGKLHSPVCQSSVWHLLVMGPRSGPHSIGRPTLLLLLLQGLLRESMADVILELQQENWPCGCQEHPPPPYGRVWGVGCERVTLAGDPPTRGLQ